MGRTLRRAVTLAAGLAAVLAASPPSVEALTCTANVAVPPTLRGEGLTEQAGDIVLNCPNDGTPPTSNQANVPLVNVTVFFNTTVTSRVLSSGAPPFFSEALLILDEAGTGHGVPLAPCQTASGVCQNKGNGVGSGYYVGQPGSNGNVNVFQGTVNPAVAPNALTFAGVPLDPPASMQTRTLRITNLRVNANAFGLQGTTPVPAIGFVSVPSVAVNSPQQVVGFVQTGHATALRNAANDAELNTPAQLRSCDQTTNLRLGTLRFTENFATAFSKRNPGSTLNPSFTQDTVPGVINNTETIFFSSSLVGHPDRGNLNTAGLPDGGTRLVARFEGVPPGVRLFVDTQATPVGAQNQGAWLTPTEQGPFVQLPSSDAGPPGTSEVALAGGRGSAVWEITEGNPLAAGSLDTGVYASYPAGGAGAGTAEMAMGLAPGVDTAAGGRASSGPVPRFDGAATTKHQLLGVAACPGFPAQGASLSALSLSRSRFPAASRGGSIARPSAAGARVRYTLSAPATTRFFVDRKRARRRGYRRLRGSFKHLGSAGRNSFRFTGRLRRRALAPGRYRLVAAPVLAGGKLGAAKRVRFRIVG
jgi:hypothetical protein